MKIPREFPQFADIKALVIVAGKQEAVLYLFSDGTINNLGDFKIQKPQYTDKPGQFRVRGKGKTMSIGSVKEFQEDELIMNFLREFKSRIKTIADFEEMYIFAPQTTKDRILSALSRPMKSKVVRVIEGNFFKRHPLELLAKLDDDEPAPVPADRPEARKIMEKSKQARTVIKGK